MIWEKLIQIYTRPLSSLCRLKSTKEIGEILSVDDVEFLRPCEKDALTPFDFIKLGSVALVKSIKAGESLRWGDFG